MNMPLNTSANINDPIEQARYNMIEQQIRPWNVLDFGVLALLQTVRREEFVPAEHRSKAFMDMEIPLLASAEAAQANGQCMLAPRVEARLLQDLEVKSTDNVLEIGTGTGYMAALLAHQANRVTSLEIDPEIADIARGNLSRAGIDNVEVLVADGADAQEVPEGQFDVIVLSGSVASVPASLLARLKDGGRLAAIVGQLPMMRATFVRKNANQLTTSEAWDTVAARLQNFNEPSRFTF